MKHGKEAAYLITLLHSGSSGEVPETPNILLDWEWLHEISSRHKVSYIAYDGIKLLPKGKKPSDEIIEYFEKDIEEMREKNKMQIEEVNRLILFFKKEKISLTLLYDWPTKELYPLPEMREVDMIDILLDTPIDEKIDIFMNSLGYDIMHKGVSSTIYSNDPMIYVRLHSSLFWNDETLKEYYEDIWDKLEEIEGQEYVYRFSIEDFYILYIVRLAQRCKEAKVDLRPFFDLWKYTGEYIADLDWKYIAEEMEKLSLSTFNYKVMQLMEYWFGQEKESADSTVEKLGEFVFQSGNYGRQQTRMLIGIAQNLKDGDFDKAKKEYIKERLFLDRGEMEENYNNLQKRPYLMPLYRVGRISKGVFKDFKKSVGEYQKIQNVKKSDVKQMSALMKKIGIKKEEKNEDKS